MFAVKAKIYGVLHNQASSIAFDEASCYWPELKTPDFSAFHWSPRGNLVSIGQHFIITRVVHLPKRTETSLITESDDSVVKLVSDIITAAVRAVHSFNSWFGYCIISCTLKP